MNTCSKGPLKTPRHHPELAKESISRKDQGNSLMPRLRGDFRTGLTRRAFEAMHAEGIAALRLDFEVRGTFEVFEKLVEEKKEPTKAPSKNSATYLQPN